MRNQLGVLFFLIAAAASNGFAQESPQSPRWIWCDADRQAGVTGRFEKSFTVDQAVIRATARAVGESANVSVSLNDTLIFALEPYAPLHTRDATSHLHLGRNTVTVTATSIAGPSAFFVELNIVLADGSNRTIATDRSWTARTNDATPIHASADFGRVRDRLLIPDSRRVQITAVDNYEQWKQALGAGQGTDPAKFLIIPGFEITRIRSAAADEDSWVSLTFDRQGRAIVAMERKGLLRMTLSDDGNSIVDVQVINDSLEECRGLLFVQDDLFVNANNSKGLYRLRARGDGGAFAEPELIYRSSGGVGHGRNDLALGPDGKVYTIHGDAVDLPKHGISYLSPVHESHSNVQTREGHLLRVDPADGTIELLVSGLRNPFGIDFNADGEIFTYDADAEYDMGAPWYRPTRVNHLVTGGDYGWRGVTQSWPPYFPDRPDAAPPNFDIGKGSPTAVKFGTRSNFPARFRDALFILDWAYGRVIAVHPTPRGSSYLMTAETFLQGRPLNVTDLDFAPDGSMVLVTGGRGTQSAMYRIRYVGPERHATPIETLQQRARREFARRSRELRRKLESQLADPPRTELIDEAWQHLGNTDPWIQHAARNLLQRQALADWVDRALGEPDLRTAIAACLALSRRDQAAVRPAILRRLNKLDWQQAAPSDKIAALDCYQQCLLSTPEGWDAAVIQSVVAKLDPLYPDASDAVNQPLSELLVRLDAQNVIPRTLDRWAAARDQSVRMHCLFVLRNTTEGWTLHDRRVYFQALDQMQHYLGGAGMPDFARRMRVDAVASLCEPHRAAVDAMVVERDPPADSTLSSRPFVRDWTVDVLAAELPAGENRLHDSRRGAELFQAACATCHRVAGWGTLVGPDLTSASRRFSRRDLLEAIVTPSKVIPENYRSLMVATAGGKSYVGRPAPGGDYRSPVLRLATDPLAPSTVIEIPKTEIERTQWSSVSWMPEGLLNSLSLEEIGDLLSFIEGGGR